MRCIIQLTRGPFTPLSNTFFLIQKKRMSFSILPQVDEHKHRHQTKFYTPSTLLNHHENAAESQNDVSEVSTSLKQ